MNHNYDNYNYWEIDLQEMPSMGRLYPANTKIKLRSLSVLEIKLLATITPQNSTSICNELLEKCLILEHLTIDKLLLSDRMFLIFWIRLNSFISNNGFIVNIPECSNCKAKIEHKIKLVDLNFKYLDHPVKHSVFLPDLNLKLPLRIPLFNDSKYKVKDDIDMACLWIDTNNTMEEKYAFLSNLTALDYITLKDAIDYNYCGVLDEIEIECPNCKTKHPVKVIINDDNLFSMINLMDVLETITRIAKYSNLQITNDWSWVEVEVEQQIINKMIKEEEEFNKNELAKAKAQSGSIPHVPSMPRM